MIKLLLGTIAVVSVSGAVMAQGTDLFPELQGQFETPAVKEKVVEPSKNELKAQQDNTNTVENKKNDSQFSMPASDPFSVMADPFAAQNNVEQAGEPTAEGNLVIKFTEPKGVLPYARDFAYCSGELVLTNETNQKLEALSIKLTYRDTPTTLSFGATEKKGQQKQSLLLIGRACEDILLEPQMEVLTCKMPPQSEESCKKRVQFIPPNG